MKYFLIAGEASGDLHASNLMRGLIRSDPSAQFRYMGGELMESVAPGHLIHYRETSYMMLDFLFHLGKIVRVMRTLKQEIRAWQPDVVIPVDFPGFNLRLARFATGLGLKVYYFISPKVWAWKQKRVYRLKSHTDGLFVILPFEVEYFRKFGMEAEYHGNPLVDTVSGFLDRFEGAGAWRKRMGLDQRPIVALLAGSRRKEIEATLPGMVRIAATHPEYTFVVAGAPSLEPALYESYLKGSDVRIVFGETYPLLASSEAGLVTSGTATLEAALLDLPQAVVYKTGWIAYTLAKWIIKVNFISLVNLIIDKELVTEIIQRDLDRRMASEFARITGDDSARETIREGYRQIREILGEPGVADRIGRRMVQLLNTGEA
jgi:lipid-A-disaccharide synthase